MQNLPIVGQVVLALFFIMNGFSHFTQMTGMVGYAASKKVPAPKLAVGVTGLMLVAGGLSILTGYNVKMGIWILVVFLLGVNIFMHNFWSEKDAQMKMMNKVQFMKNSAILGALLMLLANVNDWPWAL